MNTPKGLWCYCAELYAGVRRFTALNIHSLKGRVPEERQVGDTPDISEYAQFNWYDWVEYYEPAEAGDKEAKYKLGRFCEVAKNVGPSCTYWIITANAEVVVRSTVTTLLDERRRGPAWQEQMADHQERTKNKIGDHQNKDEVAAEIGEGTLPDIPDDLFDELEEIYNNAPVSAAVESDALLLKVDDYTADSMDTYLNAEVVLPRGGIMSKGKVVKRCKNSDLKPIGLRNENPVLDTCEYVVEFEDGETSTCQANLIS